MPEASRRARGVPVWAAIRSLGRGGVADLIDRTCARAAELAGRLEAIDGVRVRTAEINQILVTCDGTDESTADDRTRKVLATLVAEGVCYPSSTVWKGDFGIRFSVSNWRTDEADVAAIAAAVTRAVAATA